MTASYALTVPVTEEWRAGQLHSVHPVPGGQAAARGQPGGLGLPGGAQWGGGCQERLTAELLQQSLPAVGPRGRRRPTAQCS